MSELLVIALVGLPARGKSHMAKKLTNFLNWQGIHTQIFNVGNARRKANSTANKLQDASYFNSANKNAEQSRNNLAMGVLDEVCKWLSSGQGLVAIFDATNTTIERRKMIYDKVVRQNDLKLFFLESICDDQEIVHSNVRNAKLGNDDYKEMNPEMAFDDFMGRVEMYEKKYEPLDEIIEDRYSFVKIINVGKQIVPNRLQGSMQYKIVHFLSSLNIEKKSIYFCRKEKYLRSTFKYNDENLQVWSPVSDRYYPCPVQSVHQHKKWPELNDAGPIVSNKELAYKLETLIFGLENSKSNILVVAPDNNFNCLLAYFEGKSYQETSEYRKIRL